MTIKLNNNIVRTSGEDISLEEFLKNEGISLSGTAVARNGKLVERKKWSDLKLEDNDDLVIISAAFGG